MTDSKHFDIDLAASTVSASVDAMTAIVQPLLRLRDEAPNDVWRDAVQVTIDNINSSLSPYTFEDDGSPQLTVEYDPRTAAVLVVAAHQADILLDAIDEVIARKSSPQGR